MLEQSPEYSFSSFITSPKPVESYWLTAIVFYSYRSIHCEPIFQKAIFWEVWREWNILGGFLFELRFNDNSPLDYCPPDNYPPAPWNSLLDRYHSNSSPDNHPWIIAPRTITINETTPRTTTPRLLSSKQLPLHNRPLENAVPRNITPMKFISKIISPLTFADWTISLK